MKPTSYDPFLFELDKTEKAGRKCCVSWCKRKVKFFYNHVPERTGYYCCDHFPFRIESP